jgi:tetratricopeptide (TPR) repeat protein
MINTRLSVSLENTYLEPFEERVDILLHELELAAKWQRPSVIWAIYSSEYVRADADTALERRLHNLGQSTHHIKIKNQKSADVSSQIADLGVLDNVVFFVDGLRWGADREDRLAYHTLDNRREFFIDNQIRIVFWLTEKEAIDLAHYAPDYWALRHRVIEFVDSPKPDQISKNILESTWQGTGDFTDSNDDLDAKIALRTALLIDLPAGTESTSARAHLLLTLGMLHWRRGDYDRAIQFLNSALDQSAGLEDNYFEALCFNAIALVQTNLGGIEEAIQAFQNAIKLAPDQISPWNNLGHLYRKLGNHAEALAAFQKAIEINDTDAVGWNGLGDTYHDTGKNDEAILAYLKAIEFSPEFAHSWSGLGNSYMSEGRLEEALSAHQKAIEIDHCTVNSWLGMGAINRIQGKNENASMAYRTALELDPKNDLAWNELGNLCFTAGALDEALRSYVKGIEANHGCCQTHGNLASIYVLKGIHAEAIPHLLKAIELSDDITVTACLWNKLGDAYQQLEDSENANAAYRKAEALGSETACSGIGKSMPLSEPQLDLSQDSSDLQSSPSQDMSDPQLTPSDETSDQHLTTSQDNPDQPVSHLRFDPTEEEPRLPEDSKSAAIDLNESAFVPKDTLTDSTKPDEDFLEWLDGLSCVPFEKSEMTGSTPSFPNKGENMDSGDESEGETLFIESERPTLPIEEEICVSTESSPEYSDNQVHSDLPSEGGASETSYQTLNSSTDIEKADPSMANSDCENTNCEETAIISKGTSQETPAEGEDPDQSQVTINEKNALIWNELGNIYYNTGAFDEAMHAFEMAIELDPAYGWSYNNLASIYIYHKRYVEAIPLYEKGLQLLDDQKDKAVLWNRMGDAYRRLNEHDQAVTAYRKAMDLDPENVSLLTRARFSLLGNLRV